MPASDCFHTTACEVVESDTCTSGVQYTDSRKARASKLVSVESLSWHTGDIWSVRGGVGLPVCLPLDSAFKPKGERLLEQDVNICETFANY